MAALCLTIVAPVVSRTLAGSGAAAMDPWCDMHHASGEPASGLPHGHPLQKCGYCGLLACHPLLPAAASLPPAPPPLVELLQRAPVMSRPHADRPLASAPRGPPQPGLA